MREGWKCPRCEAINAPDVRKCDCPVKAAMVEAKSPAALGDYAEFARKQQEMQRVSLAECSKLAAEWTHRNWGGDS
jgi:hypothetical protein